MRLIIAMIIICIAKPAKNINYSLIVILSSIPFCPDKTFVGGAKGSCGRGNVGANLGSRCDYERSRRTRQVLELVRSGLVESANLLPGRPDSQCLVGRRCGVCSAYRRCCLQKRESSPFNAILRLNLPGMGWFCLPVTLGYGHCELSSRWIRIKFCRR